MARENLDKQERTMKVLVNMSWANKLSKGLQFELWHQTVISKFLYAK